MAACDVDPRPLENVLRGCECGLAIAANDVARRADELLLALRFVDREDRLEFLDVDLDGGLRELNRFASLGRDHDNGLADECDDILRQQDFVLDDRAEEIVREIVVCEEGDDARHGARRGGVERSNPSVRDRRPEVIDDQLVLREGQVIDVQRFATDVAHRGIVRNIFSDGAHALTSCQNLLRMFSASCSR